MFECVGVGSQDVSSDGESGNVMEKVWEFKLGEYWCLGEWYG